jgi:hypothetical protein
LPLVAPWPVLIDKTPILVSMAFDERLLTSAEAHEAAYRFVWQYAEREPESVALQLMLVAMEPTADADRTNDPAAWEDWVSCVADIGSTPVPRFPEA